MQSEAAGWAWYLAIGWKKSCWARALMWSPLWQGKTGNYSLPFLCLSSGRTQTVCVGVWVGVCEWTRTWGCAVLYEGSSRADPSQSKEQSANSFSLGRDCFTSEDHGASSYFFPGVSLNFSLPFNSDVCFSSTYLSSLLFCLSLSPFILSDLLLQSHAQSQHGHICFDNINRDRDKWRVSFPNREEHDHPFPQLPPWFGVRHFYFTLLHHNGSFFFALCFP